MTFLKLSVLISFALISLSYQVPNTNKDLKQIPMGISIHLYRLPKAEKLVQITDLESQLKKTQDTNVDLYKITGDLAVIFSNSINPYRDRSSAYYKMLFGRKAELSTNYGEVGGFLPSSDVAGIVKWIKENKIETFDGFSKIYDSLSDEVKAELDEMGSDDKLVLFSSYVRPLVVLYFTALENENSILFIGQ